MTTRTVKLTRNQITELLAATDHVDWESSDFLDAVRILRDAENRPGKFVVWNPEKVLSAYGMSNSASRTLVGLREAERLTAASISSVVTTNDIEEFLAAVHNECDIKLCSAEIDQ
jgi:hypothetical protein